MSVYTCRRCDYSQEVLWEGYCPGCRGLYRAKKIGVESAEQKSKSTFAAAAASTTVYVPTGVTGFDKVLGGGLVAGSPILLAGFHSAGKSSLLCLVADGITKVKERALYASSEEGVEGIHSIAKRLNLLNENVEILGNQQNVESVIKYAKETRPFLTVFDSLQKFSSDTSGGSPGSIAQEHAVCSAILDYCRETKKCAIIVSQMAKSGEIKGSSDSAHAVDTVLVLGYPGDNDADAPDEEEVRMLVVEKNRRGSAASTTRTYWKMHGELDPHPGLLEHIPARSKLIDTPRRGKYQKRA